MTTAVRKKSGDDDVVDASGDEAALLLDELSGLRAQCVAMESRGLGRVGKIDERQAPGARNLLHYLALRRRDLRGLQDRLAALGLSSLGRAEPRVMENLDAVIAVLRRLTGAAVPASADRTNRAFMHAGVHLDAQAQTLLGPRPARRDVRILVTLPSEAADDPGLLRSLVASGTDCVRINCAHDDRAAWSRMIANVRLAEKAEGRRCGVLMDLAGPKIRTGPTPPGPSVVKWKPQRDALGRVTAAANLWLFPDGARAAPPSPAAAAVPVSPAWLAALRPDDVVELTDARGAKRALTVGRVSRDGAWAECAQTAYVTPGLLLLNGRADAAPREGRVGGLKPTEGVVRVRPGDPLAVVAGDASGTPAQFDEAGVLVAPARISCTLPEAFRDVRAGERIFFDDGLIGGVVRAADAGGLLVEITNASPGGDRLGADKGINLPDSDLQLPALTLKDREDLEFVVAYADGASLSFVRSEQDVRTLHERLDSLRAPEFGVVLKIETRSGFERLPEVLLEAMRRPCVGVMIARGDLAVECGYERLAEIQEEILWICEAAHVPAIWATQVLEGLAKDGRPSRSEITDAAMGERAECVMLNKGPHVVEAVRTLADILGRMEAHHRKKRSMLRSLRIARDFGGGAD